jgi:outer membrane receptor for ferrienterochelin and colicin
MKLEAVSANVVVTVEREQVSLTPQAATTFTAEVLDKLPVDRTLLSAVYLAPGLNQNGPKGAVTISGALSYDNLFLVNGANIMENLVSTPLNLFVEDAIQETTVTTGGISAEYGRFAGGVINTITKSGGNGFSGSVRTNFSDPAWAAVQPLGSPGLQEVDETYEATFGGPILKDKIWFFGSGRYGILDSTYTTPGTLIPVNQSNKDERYEGKLTISPIQNHTLTVSYLNWTRDQGNYFFNAAGTYDLASLYDRQIPSNITVVNYNGVLTSQFFVEGQYSAKHFTFENGGSRSEDLITGTPIWDFTNNAFWNSPIFCAVCPGAAEQRNNDDVFAKATYFLSTPSIGSHNVVVGVDQFRGHHLSNNYQSGSQYIALSDDTHFVGQTAFPQFTPGVSYLGYYPIVQLTRASDMQTQSAFLNDTWKLNNNISFNLGLRYDKNHAVDMSGVLRQKDSAWSPRLGITVDPKGDGKLKFNASYARYVSAVQEGFAGSATGAGSPAYYYYLYGGPPINTGSGPWLSAAAALAQFFSWFGINHSNMFPTLNQDNLVGGSYPGLTSKIADGLMSPHTDEIALGVAGAAGPHLTYRVDGTYRKAGGLLESVIDTSTGQVTDPFGNVLDVSLLRNGGSEYWRTYYGLAAQFAWRPVDRLSLGGNWTWSHTYGNYLGEYLGAGGGLPLAIDLNSYPEYKRASWYAPVGDLPEDQRHRVRLFGSYDFLLPKTFGNFGVGAVFQANTGTPYGAVGNVEVGSYVTNPGYATPPANEPYYLSSRGAFTTGAWYQLDLSLNYSHNIGPVQLFVHPQILNVFNAQHIANNTYIDTVVYTALSKGYLKAFNPFTTAQNSLVECPQGASGATCQAMGANWQPDATFGQANNALAYQTPQTFILSVGVRF